MSSGLNATMIALIAFCVLTETARELCFKFAADGRRVPAGSHQAGHLDWNIVLGHRATRLDLRFCNTLRFLWHFRLWPSAMW